MPSAVHYVGYVEDDETPQSIAHKFEELERIQAAARGATAEHASSVSLLASTAAPGAGAVPADHAPLDAAAITADAHRSPAEVQTAAEEGLTDEQLMQVFKQTSIFTVRSAADGNAALMQREPPPGGLSSGTVHRDSGDELVSDGDDIGVLQSFWSDDDDQDYSEHWKRLKKLQKKWVAAVVLVDCHAALPVACVRAFSWHLLTTPANICRRHNSAPKVPRERGVSSSRPRHDVVTHYNAATQALIRRKVLHLHHFTAAAAVLA
jgi:hypothetical protein